jgi:hypothetical protein
MQVHKVDVYLKWLATGLLIGGSVLTSGNWLYPWNVVLFLLGNAAWATVGFLWKEYSIIVLNVGITGIYIVGLTVKYFSF